MDDNKLYLNIEILEDSEESYQDRKKAVEEIKEEMTARGFKWDEVRGGEMYPIPVAGAIRAYLVKKGIRDGR